MVTSRQFPNDFGELVKSHRKEKNLTQVELAAVGRCDNTIISKTEKGKLLPSKTTVEALAKGFDLEGEEYNQFLKVYEKCVLLRAGFEGESGNESSLLKSDETVEVAENFLREIKMLREAGMPKIAASFAEYKIEFLKRICDRNANNALRQKLAGYLSMILTEVGKSYMDFLKPADVWEHMAPIILLQQEVTKKLKDPVPSILSDINEESAYYVSRDYKQAYKIGKRIMPHIAKLDIDWQLEVVRASVINAGYLGIKEEIDYFSQLIAEWRRKDIIKEPISLAFVLEGLARAQAQIRNQAALNTILEAFEAYQSTAGGMRYSPLRKVQLIRSELKAAERLGSKDYRHLEAVGNQGVAICIEQGYDRYLSEIKTSLSDILNR